MRTSWPCRVYVRRQVAFSRGFVNCWAFGRMLQPPNNSRRPSRAVVTAYPPSTYIVGSWRSYLAEALVKATFLSSSAAVTLHVTTSYKRLDYWTFWPPQNPTKDLTQRTARRVTAQRGMVNKCTKPTPGCQAPELARPKKGPGLICAKHPSGRSGKLNLVPFSARFPHPSSLTPIAPLSLAPWNGTVHRLPAR